MDQETYYRLKKLPENEGLSESEFQMKYSQKVDAEDGYNCFKSSKIEGLDKFKSEMSSMKNSMKKRVVKW